MNLYLQRLHFRICHCQLIVLPYLQLEILPDGASTFVRLLSGHINFVLKQENNDNDASQIKKTFVLFEKKLFLGKHQ